jgi:hypothetical protein
MLKKIRKALRKIGPVAFVLVTMTTSYLSTYKNVVVKSIE